MSHVIIPNKHRIISLHLWDPRIVQEFFTHCDIYSTFNRLESIILYGLLSSKLISILSYFEFLPHLRALTINLNDVSSIDLREIYRMIFRLPSLKYNSLSSSEQSQSNALIPITINERFSTIQSLFINHSCTLHELISILHYTPQLRHLTCQNLVETDTNIDSEVSIDVPNLIRIIIDNCHVEFDEFETFIKKICSQLQILRIINVFTEEVIDPGQWKELILKYMPHLRKFTVRCLMHAGDNFQTLNPDTFVHQFNSRFWFERGWNIRFDIEPEELFYLIYSNRYSKKNLLS